MKTLIFNNFNLLQQSEGKWTFEKKSGEVDLSPEEIDKLIQKTTSIPVHNFLNSESFNIDEIATVLFVFTTVMDDSTSLQWKFVKDGENDALVSRSDLPYLLRTSKWLVEDILEIIAQKEEQKEAPTPPLSN